MAATFHWYYSASKKFTDGTMDLDTHTFKVMLTTASYTFDATHGTKSQITNEITAANGYTAGGVALTGVTLTTSTGTTTFDAADPYWDASGGSIVARRAVVYDDTATDDDLVCCIDLDTADVTTTTGNRLTLNLNAAGLFAFTQA